MSKRIRTPKRESTHTYDRTVTQARQQPVARPRSSQAGLRITMPWDRLSEVRGGWRWVSGSLVLIIGIALAITLTAERFYVTQIEVGGLRTMPAEEIFAASGSAGYQIFWIDPDQIARDVARSPSIATASVRVFWPSRVIIQVSEREPALVWVQDGKRYWVDVRGNLMAQRQNLPNLIQILSESPVVPVGCPGLDCPDDISGRVSIERDVAEGALQLNTLRTEIDQLYYDPISGLSFDDERGWRAFFGVGTNMDQKMLVYETIAADLRSRNLIPDYIDVSNLEAPFYKLYVTSG